MLTDFKRYVRGCRVLLLVAALGLGSGLAMAQEAGGDLGSSLGVFGGSRRKAKNPEVERAKPKAGARPTATAKPNAVRPNAANNPAASRKPVNAASAADRLADALDDGNTARNANNFAIAEKNYQTALKLKPNSWQALYGLGNVYSDQQLWAQAESFYRKAVAANSKNADIWGELSYVLRQPRATGNNAALLAESEQAARRAITLAPQDAEKYDALGSVLEERGILNSTTEDAYRKALQLDANFAAGYVHLARFLTKTNRASEAAPLYDKALQLAEDEDTLILIAQAFQSEQRWAESEPLLQRALAKDPKNPSALYHLARAQSVAQQYDDAEQTLKKLVAVTPRNFEPHYLLGSVYLRANRLEEAETTFAKAAEYAGNGQKSKVAGPFGLQGLGDKYYSAGRYAEALRSYRRALQLDPNNAALAAKIAAAEGKANDE